MNARLLLACFAFPALAHAQSAAPSAAPVLNTTGAFFALSVADVDASAAWYAEHLGLHVTTQIPKRDKVAVKILEGGGLIVELVQHDDSHPREQPAAGSPGPHGLFKAGVIVTDFDKTLAALRDRRVELAYGPYAASTTQRANVIIKDNAGNLIQIFGSK
jgi:catechol 2,3-dioxygenase-like lactoylglutathione lyase family enzyme